MTLNKSKIKTLEKKINKYKLKLLLESGEYIYLDEDDLLSLLNESFKYRGIGDNKGNVRYRELSGEMSEEMAQLEQVLPGQDDLIDMIKRTIENYKIGVINNEKRNSESC